MRGYGRTDKPGEIERYTILRLAGGVVALGAAAARRAALQPHQVSDRQNKHPCGALTTRVEWRAGMSAYWEDESSVDTFISKLPPGYFALVMATGIVSVAALGFGYTLLATSLFVVNLIAYAVLIVLNGCRAAFYPRLMFGDLVDHRLGPGFFTLVPASCLIGVQSLLIAGSEAVAVRFLPVGIALWAGLTYTIFLAFTVKSNKPPLERGITGRWLIAVVASQSVVVLSTLVARTWADPGRAELEFFALCMWLWGVMLYIWIMALIFYRNTFFSYVATDFDAPSWIGMGALAISTLAGASLAQNAQHAPFLASLMPFLKGFTLLCWAVGTWWIPMLLALTIWRLSVDRRPPRYHPTVWAAVFPLGMYSRATRQLADTFDLRFLDFPAWVMFIIALCAWTLAFAGMLWDLREMARNARRFPAVKRGGNLAPASGAGRGHAVPDSIHRPAQDQDRARSGDADNRQT